MIYLSILLLISLVVSIHPISGAEDKRKSTIVYGTKDDVVKAKKKLDELSDRCLWINVVLFLIVLYTMMKS